MESDAGGFTPRGFGFTVSDTSWNKIYNWHTLLEPYYGDKFTRGGDGTDIEPLHETFGTPVSGLSPDSQRYFDVHHAPSDVFEFVTETTYVFFVKIFSFMLIIIICHILL